MLGNKIEINQFKKKSQPVSSFETNDSGNEPETNHMESIL
jgi:hypothetical protein